MLKIENTAKKKIIEKFSCVSSDLSELAHENFIKLTLNDRFTTLQLPGKFKINRVLGTCVELRFFLNLSSGLIHLKFTESFVTTI